MATLGRIKILVDRYPLSAAKQAYDDFQHGRLVGRAVLIPAPMAAPGADAAATGSSRHRASNCCRVTVMQTTSLVKHLRTRVHARESEHRLVGEGADRCRTR